MNRQIDLDGQFHDINETIHAGNYYFLAQSCTIAGKHNCTIDENEQCGVLTSNGVCYCDNNCTNCCGDVNAGKLNLY